MSYVLVVYIRNGSLEQEAFMDDKKMEAFAFAEKVGGFVINARSIVVDPGKNTEYVVWKEKQDIISGVVGR